ncbi:Uncharacterised protein [Serratia fonticola]|nr:Uncharacterised protein [Serratia fonticola]CAI2023013.1 Uncharacterised protein [Serratia fonticola]
MGNIFYNDRPTTDIMWFRYHSDRYPAPGVIPTCRSYQKELPL